MDPTSSHVALNPLSRSLASSKCKSVRSSEVQEDIPRTFSSHLVKGKKFFAEGDWSAAIDAYTEALKAWTLSGQDEHIASTTFSNRSAAFANVGDWQSSLDDAVQVQNIS